MNLPYAVIYIAENKPTLVASIHHNAAGIMFEQATVDLLREPNDAEALGKALWSALAKFSYMDVDLRGSRKTDWPSYRASKCKSGDKFEKTYSTISVRALNVAAITFQASTQPEGEKDLGIVLIFLRSMTDETLGLKLLKLHRVSRSWYDRLEDVLDEA